MSSPDVPAVDRAELALSAARRRVPLDLVEREHHIAARLRRLAASVPSSIRGARAEITLTATALEYGLESHRSLLDHLQESARASRVAGVLLPQAHPSKALFAARGDYLEQAALIVEPLVEQAPTAPSSPVARTVIDAAREQDPLFVGSTLPSPSLRDDMRKAADARRKGGG